MKARHLPGVRTVIVAILIVTLALPILWMAISAVLPRSVLLDPDYTFLPDLTRADPLVFVRAALEPELLRWLGNSALITVVSTLLGLGVSIPAGYSLSRYAARGQTFMGLGLLLSLVLPGTLLVLPLFMMFTQYSLVNNRIAVAFVVSITVVPFSTWLTKSFFDSIPRSIEEAAALDGCSRMSAFVRVVLPLAKPAVAAVTAYSVIWSWSDFLFSKTLITDQDHWPVTVGIVSFIGQHTTDWGAFMATGLISALPLMIMFYFLEPWLVSGFGSGSVKQ